MNSRTRQPRVLFGMTAGLVAASSLVAQAQQGGPEGPAKPPAGTLRSTPVARADREPPLDSSRPKGPIVVPDRATTPGPLESLPAPASELSPGQPPEAVPPRAIADSPLDPPPPRAEVMPAEPSPDHVWIAGHWERDPDKWTWVEGEWIKPPFLPVRWVPGYWRHQLGKFHWVSGHWADGDGPGMVVMKPVPAPAAIEETPPPAPNGQSWVPGEWSWNGSWSWLPGFYATPPTPLSKWAPGHWQAGLLGKWKWVPGHWTLL